VYLRDRVAGTTKLVTTDPEHGYGDRGEISGNGRYVVYYSVGDILRWDRLTEKTVVLPWGPSLGHDNGYSGVSSDGRLVGIQGTNYDQTTSVSLIDVQKATVTGIHLPVTLAHPTWGFSIGGMSPDGRFLALLVGRVGDVYRGQDVYVYNVQTRQARLAVSVSRQQMISNKSLSVSPDGRRVAFATAAQLVPSDTDHVSDLYEWSSSGGIRRVSAPVTAAGPRARSFAPSYSADGSRLAFTSAAGDLVGHDSNGETDVFLTSTR
jgi:WD40 repeat protein